MPADTPAPSPSQESSALDALLREVDRARNDPRSYREETMDPWLHAKFVQADAAPRLAAIVRVLTEALEFYESGSRNAFRCNNEPLDPAKGTGPCCERVIDAGGIAQDALARAEAIAKGE